jgi:hypothetical protein
MMMSEFIERTGFQPTYNEYQKIEEAYYDFAGDKNEFCKRFVAENGEKKIYAARAAYISDLESQLIDNEKSHKAEVGKLQEQIKELTAELDKELEWRSSDGTGTNMCQRDYEALAALCDGTHGDPHEMTDAEAEELITSEFGFATKRVQIIRTVHAYEVNKYHQLRKSAEYSRRPLYDVSDYNYVRFDVNCGHATWMYEMVNGELMIYSC